MDMKYGCFTRTLAAITCAALVSMSLPALAAKQNSREMDEKIVRANDMIAELVPWGKIMDLFISTNPNWPLNEHADKVSPTQLTCLREKLSGANLTKQKLDEVKTYAAADPERFESDYQLLDTGFAPLFGKFFMAGVDQARSGEKPDMMAIMNGASNAQMMAMTSFLYEGKYKGLRDLTGLGDLMGATSGSDQKERGQNIGKVMVTKLMLKAMDACAINMADLMAAGVAAPAATRASAVEQTFDAVCNNPIDKNNKQAVSQPTVLRAAPLTFPEYPPASKRANEEGTAMVSVYVTEEGRIARATIQRSSGFFRLDQAAVDGTRDWSMSPGRVGKTPACMWVTVPVVFKLSSPPPPVVEPPAKIN
jgi:TonB family protein